MPIQGLKNTQGKENKREVFQFPTSKNALIIFTRNPELGKCKTRLAATVGDEAALDIYRFLIDHTVKITQEVSSDKFVFYSIKPRENDSWSEKYFRKEKQEGADLGLRMENAFIEVFKLGYERAIIIGSDMYDFNTNDINNGFEQLKANDFVIGPAEDGGYYLLGMKKLNTDIFHKKKWGTETVLKDTLVNLASEKIAILEEKNDVDYYEDISEIKAFQPFLQNLK